MKALEVGVLVEVEAFTGEDFAGTDFSDIELATVEVGLGVNLHKYVQGQVLFLYEEGGSGDVEVDEAYIFLGNTDEYPLYLQAGKFAVPFGNFDTAMIADPLTLEIGETKEVAVLVGGTTNGLSLEAFGFNGDSQQAFDDDQIDQFGVALRYAGEFSGLSVAAGASYVNNIADSDALTDALGGNATLLQDYVGGVEGHVGVSFGSIGLFGSYMTATDDFTMAELPFNGAGAEPSAFHIEGTYTTEIQGRETVFALTYQGSDEALAMGLPEERFGGAVTVGLFDGVALPAEYLRDDDYSVSVGGTGDDGYSAALRLALEL